MSYYWLCAAHVHTKTISLLPGTVVVWWASTGLIMMKSKVHAGPVQQLQFDATKVRWGSGAPVGVASWLRRSRSELPIHPKSMPNMYCIESRQAKLPGYRFSLEMDRFAQELL